MISSQFVRYVFAGGISNGILYFIYLGLTLLGLPAKPSMTIVYCLGVIFGFLLNKNWSFRYTGSNRSSFFRYCASYALGYILNLSGLYFLIDKLELPHYLAQGLMMMVVAVFLFFLQRTWVFLPD